MIFTRTLRQAFTSLPSVSIKTLNALCPYIHVHTFSLKPIHHMLQQLHDPHQLIMKMVNHAYQ